MVGFKREVLEQATPAGHVPKHETTTEWRILKRCKNRHYVLQHSGLWQERIVFRCVTVWWQIKKTALIFIVNKKVIPGVEVFLLLLFPHCVSTHWPPAVCLRDRSPVVSGRSVLRAVFRDLPPAGEHPAAGEARRPGAAVRLELLLHLDLPSGAGLEQIHREQDWNNLWARLVRNQHLFLCLCNSLGSMTV